MDGKVAVVILAAGSSKRMGRAKQLLPWRGLSLVRHVAERALEIPLSTVFVVVGAYEEAVRGTLENLDVTIIFNPDYESGLGSSLACGASYLLTHGDPAFSEMLILLADQPTVSPAYLSRLIDSSRLKNRIAATAYGRGRGVPAIFPRRYWTLLSDLTGDSGAGRLLNSQEHPVSVIQPDFDLFDIDTPEDYKRHEGDTERH